MFLFSTSWFSFGFVFLFSIFQFCVVVLFLSATVIFNTFVKYLGLLFLYTSYSHRSSEEDRAQMEHKLNKISHEVQFGWMSC